VRRRRPPFSAAATPPQRRLSSPSKDRIAFLIDASPAMRAAPRNPALTGGRSYLEHAVAFARALLKARVIASPSDEVAIVFYNTRAKRNPAGFDATFMLQPLAPATADRIRRLGDFSLAAFDEEAGSAAPEAGAPGVPLKWGLWTCGQLLTAGGAAARHADKKIFLFTNEAEPCRGEAGRQTRSARRAQGPPPHGEGASGTSLPGALSCGRPRPALLTAPHPQPHSLRAQGADCRPRGRPARGGRHAAALPAGGGRRRGLRRRRLLAAGGAGRAARRGRRDGRGAGGGADGVLRGPGARARARARSRPR